MKQNWRGFEAECEAELKRNSRGIKEGRRRRRLVHLHSFTKEKCKKKHTAIEKSAPEQGVKKKKIPVRN